MPMNALADSLFGLLDQELDAARRQPGGLDTIEGRGIAQRRPLPPSTIPW